MRLWGSGGAKDTYSSFRPLKSLSATAQDLLSEAVKKTLPGMSITALRDAVQRPSGIHINEWLVMNTTELFNDLSMLYGIISADIEDVGNWAPGEGFPKGFEYRWVKVGGERSSFSTGFSSSTASSPSTSSSSSVAGRNGKKTQKKKTVVPCSAHGYVGHVMDWVDSEIDTFPEDFALLERFHQEAFRQQITAIFKRLFRVYAILYGAMFRSHVALLGMEAHVNMSLKHFVYFTLEHELMAGAEREFLPLQRAVDAFRVSYDAEGGEMGEGRGPRRGHSSVRGGQDEFVGEQTVDTSADTDDNAGTS
jgi:MOB kinase activator 1